MELGAIQDSEVAFPKFPVLAACHWSLKKLSEECSRIELFEYILLYIIL